MVYTYIHIYTVISYMVMAMIMTPWLAGPAGRSLHPLAFTLYLHPAEQVNGWPICICMYIYIYIHIYLYINL